MAIDQLSKVSRGPTLVERVVAQIEQLIRDGELPKGHRLPAERPLGERLGVSRTVLREAVSALVAKGLLVSVASGGYEVASPSMDSVSQSLTMFLRSGEPNLDYAQVHEVRQLLEVQIATLAASRRTDADLENLETCHRRMTLAAGPLDPEPYSEADVDFHLALAAASHNPLLSLLLETLSDVMKDVRRLGVIVPEATGRALTRHQAILDAVKLRDPEAAKTAMEQHLEESYQTVKSALQKSRGDKA